MIKKHKATDLIFSLNDIKCCGKVFTLFLWTRSHITVDKTVGFFFLIFISCLQALTLRGFQNVFLNEIYF